MHDKNMERDRIFTVLSQHERALADIYLLFADQFPQQRDFWRGLAADEVLHSGWVDQLSKKATAGSIELKDGSFSIVEAESWLAALRSRLQELKREQLSLPQALILALDFENSILDKRFIRALTGMTGQALDVLGNLEAQTRAHAEKISSLLKQISAAE